jgi:transposase
VLVSRGRPLWDVVPRARTYVGPGQRHAPVTVASAPAERTHHRRLVLGCPRQAEPNPEEARQTLSPCCAGLDVPKATVVAGVRRARPGGPVRKPVRTLGTRAAPLLERRDGLVAEAVTHAALAPTGVYGKPVGHRREGPVQALRVNAQHRQQVPGRQTDVPDGAWLAPWRQHGLLQARCVPPPATRQWRHRTRQRAPRLRPAAPVADRIPTALADANRTLGAVASAVLGESGRDRLRAWSAGETDPDRLAARARQRGRAQIPALRRAPPGRGTDPPRFRLRLHRDPLPALEGLSGRVGARRAAALAPVAPALDERPTLPGVSQRVAAAVRAAVGTNREPLPRDGPVASWAGRCPGQDGRAGRRRRGRTSKGRRWRRGMRVPAAGAASPTQHS